MRKITMKWSWILAMAILANGCAQPNAPEPDSSDPIITELTSESSSVKIGFSTTVTVVAEDPLGEPLIYNWKATAGDFFDRGATVRYTASPCCTGLNRITVTVRNNHGGSTSQSIHIDVLP